MAALKEEAHDRIKIAKDIASQSQLEAKETIRAERSYSSARIKAITQQHKVAIERNQEDAHIIHSRLQAEHKIDLAQIRAKYESKINDLLEMIEDKREQVSKLKVSVKEVTTSAAVEKIQLKEKHWQEKLKLWNDKKELRNSVAAKVQEKKEAVTALKSSHSDAISQLEMEKKASNKTARAALKDATAKNKLAAARLVKLNTTAMVTKKLQGDLLSESAHCIELEEELSKATKWVPRATSHQKRVAG